MSANLDCAIRDEPHGAHWLAGGKKANDKRCDGYASSWRPIHHRLPNEAHPSTLPVHLMLVTDDDPQQARTACGGGLGEWITGAGEQVTCPTCLETVHA